MKYKFIVSGGGTSGHINPAITIADELKKYYFDKGHECEIIFTGRKDSLEDKLVTKAGYKMTYVEAKPFPMRISRKLFKAVDALNKGTKTVLNLIDEFKPDAVIGTGGYVCASLFVAAKKRKVPVIIHESNAFPGRLTKILGKNADLVLTGFPNLEKVFSKARKVVYTGSPIRDIMYGNDYNSSRCKLNIKEGKKFVFAMGGSLGAKTINEFIFDCAKDKNFADVDFVLSSGVQQAGDLDGKEELSNLKVVSYIDNPNDYMCAADVCITRAGAVTCAEIAAINACDVFIPYPFAAMDHQTFNAKAFADIDGGILISDSDVKEGKLKNILLALLNDKIRREKMRANAGKLAVMDCNDRIINAINEIVKKD